MRKNCLQEDDTGKKNVFTDNDTEKEKCLSWKNCHPPASKTIVLRPIDRQDTAAYSVF